MRLSKSQTKALARGASSVRSRGPRNAEDRASKAPVAGSGQSSPRIWGETPFEWELGGGCAPRTRRVQPQLTAQSKSAAGAEGAGAAVLQVAPGFVQVRGLTTLRVCLDCFCLVPSAVTGKEASRRAGLARTYARTHADKHAMRQWSACLISPQAVALGK